MTNTLRRIVLASGEAPSNLNQALKRPLIGDLEHEQVTYLDLTGCMRNQKSDLFWNQEKGHWLVAQALFRYFSAASTALCSRRYLVKAPTQKKHLKLHGRKM